jgi:TPR repeat protein
MSSPLKNPKNDATDMAKALEKLNFQVALKTDASKSQMQKAIRKFGNELKHGGVGLFFYAGHGMQVKGTNYLIPVGSDIQNEDEIQDLAVSANLVLAKMETAGNPLNIVILDACRNNPFTRSFRSSQTGLAQMDAPTGSLLVYATGPGSVAADGEGRNGLFTKYLLKHVRIPGMEVGKMLRSVRKFVIKESNNQQTPWDSSSLTGDFYFTPPTISETYEVKPQRPTVKDIESEILSVEKPTQSMVGNLQVKVDTRWVDVYINDQLRTRIADPEALFQQKNIPSGPIVVRLEPDGYKSKEIKLTILPGQWNKIDFKIKETEPLPAPYTKTSSNLNWILWIGFVLSVILLALVAFYLKNKDNSAMKWYGNLGEKYMKGAGVRKDEQKSVSAYRKAAEKGDNNALFKLGSMCLRGDGIKKSPQKAAMFYRKAAEQGHSESQFNLGCLHKNGKGVAKDDNKAVKYYHEAAEQGHAGAQFNLGLMHKEGLGIVKSDEKALVYYHKSAEQGHTNAQFHLGQMYFNGTGVKKDDTEAFKWYYKAAEKGQVDAQFNLGNIYLYGNGVEKDFSEAMTWYRKAAEKGHANAQFNLGDIFENGSGIGKDKQEALKWYRKAAKQGNRFAKESFKRLQGTT